MRKEWELLHGSAVKGLPAFAEDPSTVTSTCAGTLQILPTPAPENPQPGFYSNLHKCKCPHTDMHTETHLEIKLIFKRK